MSYPSILVTNNNNHPPFEGSFSSFHKGDYSIFIKSEILKKLIIFEDENCFFFSHTNEELKKALTEKEIVLECIPEFIQKNIKKFHWGLCCFIDKKKSVLSCYNDLFGIYPIYYLKNTDDSVVISNDYDLVLNNLKEPEFNLPGLYDYFLFNYTLNSRTIINGINQLQGGECLKSTKQNFEVTKFYDVSSYIHDKKSKKIDLNKIACILKENVLNNVDPELDIQLPLSGGFDSKVLLSVLLASGKTFNTYSYGAKNSLDPVAAESTAKTFSIPFELHEIKEKTIGELNDQIDQFIRFTSGLPLILDLLTYQQVNQKLPPSNITIGAMGGELINGPVIVSQVIITNAAKILTTSRSIEELIIGIKHEIGSISILDYDAYKEIENVYTAGLTNYLFCSDDKYSSNITRFMLNETYSKFFGVVFRNLFPRNNLIFPFTDPEFLRLLLNSQYRYSKHKAFSKNPLSHLFSRRLYPKIIQRIYNPVIYTPLDRKYVMADLLYFHRLPFTIKRYIENHLFRKNKTESDKTLNYTRWLKPILIEKLYDSPLLDMKFLDKEIILETLDKLKNNDPVSDFTIRKLILLLGLHYFQKKYNIGLKS